MSVIETFYLLFKADTKDLKKGSQEVAKESDKMESSLNAVSVASNKMKSSVVALGTTLAGLAAGIISVGLVTKSLSAAINYTQEIGAASRALNTNASDLDAWGHAVQRTGGTAAQFQQSLRNLAEKLNTTPQGAMNALPKLADSFERLGRVRALQYGKLFGLDESTILLLQQGRRELDLNIKRQKELGVVTKQDAEIAKVYNDTVVDSQHAWNSLFVTLGIDVVPVLTEVVKGFTKVAVFLREHKDIITGALIAIGAVGVIIATPFLIAQAAIVGVIAVVGSLIAVFALAYDDIQGYLKGYDSLTGRILERWPFIGKLVTGVLNTISQAAKDVIMVFQTLLGLFGRVLGFAGGKLLDGAQFIMNAASSSPTNTQVGAGLLRTPSLDRSTSVSTGDITINTQATDAEGIQTAFQQTLMSHTWQSNSYHDDGVMA